MALLAAARRCVPGWLAREVAVRLRTSPERLAPEIADAVGSVAEHTLDRLATLLAMPADRQRGTPLSVFRDGACSLTPVLRAAGARPSSRSAADRDLLPGDDYGLAPATWADIDPSLHEPGLIWGAWKAMAVRRAHAGEDDDSTAAPPRRSVVRRRPS